MNLPEEEKKDPTWELLKDARPPEVSPFFARNVLRDVRQMEDARRDRSSLGQLLDWLAQPTVARASVAAALVVAMMVLIAFQAGDSGQAPNDSLVNVDSPTPAPVESIEPAVVDDFDPAEEIENLDYLGELMAVTDPGMLNDSELADLLF